jgi:hypothetical protein
MANMKSLFISATLAFVIPVAACSSNKPVASTEAQSPKTQSSPSSETNPESLIKDWYTYKAKDNSYTIQFPSKPQEEDKTVANPNVGKLKYMQVLYEDKANNRAYLTANIIYPGKSTQYNFGKDRIEKELDGIRDGQAQGSNSTVTSEKTITFNGLTGREITFKGKSQRGEAMMSRIMIDPKKPALYQLIVVSGNGNLAFPEAQAFLDSLTFPK